jgi:hypothetical protein
MKKLYFVLIFFGLSLFSACSSAKIISDLDQSKDFTQYKTYIWSAKEDPINKDFPQFDNSLNRERWRNAIDEAMQDQGFTLEEGEADLKIDFHLQFEHNVVPYHSNKDEMEETYNRFRPTPVYQYDRGTVVIHLVDLKENQVIWQGVATRILDMGLLEDPESNIQSAVNKIFKKLAMQIAKQAP